MRNPVGLLLGLLAGVVVVTPGVAQNGSISGTITDAVSGQTVAGVSISVESTTIVVSTDRVGHYRLANIAPGRVVLEVKRVGYNPIRRDVDLAIDQILSLDFVLTATATELAELTVIGSRTDLQETRLRLEQVPGGVDLVSAEEIQSTRQANLKDVLRLTPGVFVQPRFGAADESQISIRGSGLRNNFHARGINLLVNGMPYRNADGFTDFESLELLNTDAIEVYKGANALRYGGSTMGGAINLHTRTGYTAPRLSVIAEGGSFGFLKGQIASGGRIGSLNYFGSYSKTELEGFRDYNVQNRDRINAHIGYILSPSTDIRSFYFFARVNEQLPGALTAGELADDPTRANPGNRAGRWGRDYDLHHLGLQLRTQLGTNQRLEISPYFQYRDIDHPIFRVISQVSRDYGAEARYENANPVGGRNSRFVLGVQPAYMNMDNRQFDNLAGAHGQLRKDQKDEVEALAVYAEEMLGLSPRLSLIVGARFDYSTRKTADKFLADGDQSDERTYKPLSPKLGLLYALPSGAGQLFANVSRSFEPPLLLELNSLTVPGFIDLNGQDAVQFEVGTRGRSGGFRWDLSLYDVEIRDEILNVNVEPFPGAGFTVPTYRNADQTRHYGVEAGAQYGIPGPILTAGKGGDGLVLQTSYTFARYKFVDDGALDGNDVPGAPAHLLNTEFKYVHPSGFSLAPSLEWAPKSYFVNSENTESNQGWINLGLRAEWALEQPGLTVFAAGQNLTDEHRSPSVQVDNSAGRYYEPMDGRSFYFGVRWGR
jgi:iron complex outermembrane receptor protein